jgi:hypothetical protein
MIGAIRVPALELAFAMENPKHGLRSRVASLRQAPVHNHWNGRFTDLSLAYYNVGMVKKLTRRQLASLVTAAPLAAQTPAAPQPEDDLGIQRALIKRNSEQLAKVEIPMSTEPAFQFKA